MNAAQGVILVMLGVLVIYLAWWESSPFNRQLAQAAAERRAASASGRGAAGGALPPARAAGELAPVPPRANWPGVRAGAQVGVPESWQGDKPLELAPTDYWWLP